MTGFSSLRISNKLVISSMVFALPIAVLLYFLIAGLNYDIRFSTLEIYGNRYQRPLEQIMENLALFQLAKDQNNQQAAADHATRIDKAFSNLIILNSSIGEDLQFTDEGLGKRNRGHLRPNSLDSDWKNYKSSPDWNGVFALLRNLREMIAHAGDTSNLILDPNLDSYYLMDITLLALPQNQQRLDEIMHFGAPAFSKSLFTTQERLQFVVFASMLEESDLARVIDSAETSMTEDDNFYGNSPTLSRNVRPALNQYASAMRTLIQIMNMAGKAPNGSVSQEQFLEALLNARKASYRLWEVCVQELDTLLDMRIKTFKADKTTALSITGVAVAVALLLVYLIGRSVIRPVRQIQGYTRKIVQGKLDTAMEGNFTGELANLSTDVQSMVGHLREKLKAEAKTEELKRETERARQAILEAENAHTHSQKVEAYQRDEINTITDVLRAISHGDLHARYAATRGDSDTEEAQICFQDLEKALNDTIHILGTLINKVQGNSTSLASYADQIAGVSTTLRDGASNMSRQADNVASATEQISMNITTMASAAEEMSVNVSSVSSTANQMAVRMVNVSESMESMRQDIKSIGENAADGAKVAAQAAEMASTATNSMSELGEAAHQIGKVTEVIKRIAEQTNLLALNATIEAASAGEAGKGFAVVAHEIKELAHQSAKAAEDIASKIEGVQLTTEEAIKIINQVAGIIGTINASSEVITSAVEKQTQAANDIADYVSDASRGTEEISVSISELSKGANDMSQNAGEVAKGANDVAANILMVSKQAKQSKDGAAQVDSLADTLSDLASELQKLVDRFKAE